MSARDELITDGAASDPTASLAVLLAESGKKTMYDLARVATDAGYSKPDIIGYIVVGKTNDSLDWEDKLHPSEEACIDSLCGPYQDFTREPDSEWYWGNEYKLCPVLSPEATA